MHQTEVKHTKYQKTYFYNISQRKYLVNVGVKLKANENKEGISINGEQ